MVRFFILIFVAFYSVTQAQAMIMETYGDSLTAGLLDYTNINGKNELEKVSSILSDLTMFKLTQDRSFLKKHERAEYSWPNLLAQKLTGGSSNIEIRNYALTGARTNALMEEVKKATTTTDADDVIAFFFIGHNDLCHTKGSAEELKSEFTSNFFSALRDWDRKHLGARAYLISVAEVQYLYPVLDGITWYDGPKAKYRCNENWENLFPYCPAFYKKYKEGSLNEYLNPRIKEINDSLTEIVDTMKTESQRNQYFRVEMTPGAHFKSDFFAVDCYHLSSQGQSFVADQIYQSMRWQ